MEATLKADLLLQSLYSHMNKGSVHYFLIYRTPLIQPACYNADIKTMNPMALFSLYLYFICSFSHLFCRYFLHFSRTNQSHPWMEATDTDIFSNFFHAFIIPCNAMFETVFCARLYMYSTVVIALCSSERPAVRIV